MTNDKELLERASLRRRLTQEIAERVSAIGTIDAWLFENCPHRHFIPKQDTRGFDREYHYRQCTLCNREIPGTGTLVQMPAINLESPP
jgi:hypothetical protein